MSSYDVIILGAGMAGLTAARALAERNQRVLVLEARDRVGGRILTQCIGDGQTVELGAEFIHGRPPELWSLITEAGLITTEREGAMLRECENGGFEQDNDDNEEIFAPLENLDTEERPDESFSRWLAHQMLPVEAKAAIASYVEGFNAADGRVIGMHALAAQRRAENAIEGDRAWHVHGGYAQLSEYLAAKIQELGGVIQLGTAAREVSWLKGQVEVHCADGQIVNAPRAIIALPLGVLQSDTVRFKPEPIALTHAAALAMGDAARFTMVFREPWWKRSTRAPREQLENLHFLFVRGTAPNVWWTAHPEQETSPTLTAWAGGPRALAITHKSAEDFAASAVPELARVFRVEEAIVRDALVSVHTHDWHNDPLARGAYSYVPARALDAPAAMCVPEADTLFFAGEHTDVTGHWGTVHAAMRSGLRAAAQVLGEG